VIVGVLAGIKTLQIRDMIASGEQMTMPPLAVAVTNVQSVQWETTLSSVGMVTPVQGVTVRSEVAGVVTAIHFQPGADIKAGELLVELDRSTEEAEVRRAEADAELARSTLRRTKDLVSSGTIPEADLDEANARMAEVEARIESLKAALDKKTIKAAFSGTLGIREIRLGQYLNPGDPIVSLQALATVYAEFALPQRDLGKLRQGMEVRARSDAWPDEAFFGRLTTINTEINRNTHTVRLQSTFSNANKKLRPGMYLTIDVVLPEVRQVNIIPLSSLLYAPYGDSVYILNPEEDSEAQVWTVTQQIVRTGATRGDFVEIVSGLEEGQRIVSAGAFKLRNGQSVVDSDKGVAEQSEAPTPADG
jgi:membrane fusion protein (multidrug efflux system)